MGRAEGLTEDEILGVSNPEGCNSLSQLEKLAIEYALALTEAPAEVSDELFEALRAQLSEAQLIELTAVVAWENFLARFNRGFGVEADGFSEGAVCPIPDHHQARSQTGAETGGR